MNTRKLLKCSKSTEGGALSLPPFAHTLKRATLGIAAASTAFALHGASTRVVLSEKSYLIDTRCPVVAMSESCKLNTNPPVLMIIVR